MENNDYQPMKTNPLKDGIVSENSAGIGTVTREMVRARAAELAILDGHLSNDATKAHFAQAKRELTGLPDEDPKDAILESAPESERWDPFPGSPGIPGPDVPNEDDDDDEGRNESAQLAEEGVHEAEHDQMLQAEESAQQEEKSDRSGG